MNFNLEKTVEIIKTNSVFLKLKDSWEDNTVHNGESTYEHQIQAYEISKKLVSGDLITNSNAKSKFEKFLSEEIGGIKKKDLLQIVALVHDCGKIIKLNEKPLFTTINDEGRKQAPEHGYWGSLIVPKILEDTDLPEEAIKFIQNCVRLHLAGWYIWSNETPIDELLWALKLRAENYHREMIFNIYCDLFYNKTFQERLRLPIELLNMPETYEMLEVSI